MPNLVDLPVSLALDSKIKPKAKYVYLAIQMFQPSSIEELAKHTGMNYSHVSKICTQLAKQGWIIKVKGYRTVRPFLSLPEAVQMEMIKQLHLEYDMATYKGEFLMRKLLDFLIAPVNYVDNARPPFLQNPETGESLEYDRFFPDHKAAFEYQGQQHFGPTNAFPNNDEYKKRRKRDLIKAGISMENGITLVHIAPEHLSVAKMLSNIPTSLPKALVDTIWPYARELDHLGQRYLAGLSRTMAKEQMKDRA